MGIKLSPFSLTFSVSIYLPAVIMDLGGQRALSGQCVQGQIITSALFQIRHTMMKGSLSVEIARFASEPFPEFSGAI